jgi:tetratricopeptide (TPR) repeat protein
LTYANRGAAYRAQGEVERAIQDYNEAIRIDPRIVPGLLYRGIANAILERYSQAIEDYDAVLRIDPIRALALYGRGIAKLRQGDHAGGSTDIAAAQALEADISTTAIEFGVVN